MPTTAECISEKCAISFCIAQIQFFVSILFVLNDTHWTYNSVGIRRHNCVMLIDKTVFTRNTISIKLKLHTAKLNLVNILVTMNIQINLNSASFIELWYFSWERTKTREGKKFIDWADFGLWKRWSFFHRPECHAFSGIGIVVLNVPNSRSKAVFHDISFHSRIAHRI